MGKPLAMPEAEVRVSDVKAFKTKSGNTRYVLADDQGNEYSTFKEHIAAKLPGLEGKRARIKYHEQERDGFTNVYLDAVEPIVQRSDDSGASDADEVAWKTTVEAAPYLLSADALDREVSPDELFDKLQPFKELVSDDIQTPDGNG
jgi:hypothetical protein